MRLGEHRDVTGVEFNGSARRQVPVVFPFGLGFDTATVIRLFAVAASQASGGMSLSSVKIFPALSDWSSSALAPTADLSTACHTPGA